MTAMEQARTADGQLDDEAKLLTPPRYKVPNKLLLAYSQCGLLLMSCLRLYAWGLL